MTVWYSEFCIMIIISVFVNTALTVATFSFFDSNGCYSYSYYMLFTHTQLPLVTVIDWSNSYFIIGDCPPSTFLIYIYFNFYYLIPSLKSTYNFVFRLVESHWILYILLEDYIHRSLLKGLKSFSRKLEGIKVVRIFYFIIKRKFSWIIWFQRFIYIVFALYL